MTNLLKHKHNPYRGCCSRCGARADMCGTYVTTYCWEQPPRTTTTIVREKQEDILKTQQLKEEQDG